MQYQSKSTSKKTWTGTAAVFNIEKRKYIHTMLDYNALEDDKISFASANLNPKPPSLAKSKPAPRRVLW